METTLLHCKGLIQLTHYQVQRERERERVVEKKFLSKVVGTF